MNRSLILKTFILLALVWSATDVAANNSWSHYSRMKTVATGPGLVYSSIMPTDTPEYAEDESVVEYNSSSSNSSVDHNYHIYAQPMDGAYFKGWYSDADCTHLLSEESYMVFRVEATSGDAGSPTQGVAYALFEEILHTYYSTYSVGITGTGSGSVAVSAAATNHPQYGATATATQGTVRPQQTYHLYARPAAKNSFDGWYRDEACTMLISNSEECVCEVVPQSISETAPTVFKAYAKFSVDHDQVYQLRNADFEEWEDVSGGREPIDWSSFLTATGSMAGTIKAEQLQRSEDAHHGLYSARLNARNVIFGIAAQGNLTTGCINGGSMTATDANGNYNYTREDTPGQAMHFTGRPDALRVWIKSQCSGNVKIAAMLHAKGYYQDPASGNTDRLCHLVGQAVSSPANNGGQWTQYTVPFSYSSNDPADRPYYALVSFATNATPGGGSTSDVMFVDDISLVYNSGLASVRINGREVKFQDGHATYSGSYNEETLTITPDGAGASYTADYDTETATLTIRVEGDNISEDPTNTHTYTIFFEGGEEGEERYPLNFDPDTTTENPYRALNSITLEEEGEDPITFDVNPGFVYNDLTEIIVPVSDEGRAMTLSFDYTDSQAEPGYVWMHGYAYIDLDHNGRFDVVEDREEQYAGGELMTYSFYSFSTDDSEGNNSWGDYISGSNRAVVNPPAFELPSKPGYYRMRLKIDWNSVDPAGDIVQGIIKNGGYIVDCTLQVGDPDHIQRPTDATSASTLYDLQGRIVQAPAAHRSGILITDRKKLIHIHH